MSIWFRRQPKTQPTEERASSIWQPTFPFSFTGLGNSYQDIDPSQGETSLQSIAFRSGADLIASIVSELPLAVFSGEGSDRRKRSTPGYLDDPSGDGHGREDWIYQFIMSWILRGNTFGNIIDQGPTGMVRQVDLFHPDTVSVSVMEGRPVWMVSGQEIPTNRFYHKRVNPVTGALMGLSAVQAHADSLGVSLASTRFGRSWFQGGGHPSGILSNELADLSDEKVVTTAKDRFMAALFGNHEPIVLGRGWKFNSIQVTPEESQFLQTQGWSEAQCARILGAGVAEVLGYESGSSMTYANVIDRDVTLLKYAIGRWVSRVERMFSGNSSVSGWLPRPQYAILDRDAFLETSAMQRWKLNATKLATGAYTINEIRDRENDQPVPWGNKPFTMKPASDSGGGSDPNADPANPPGGDA